MTTDIILKKFLDNRPELREEIEKLEKVDKAADRLTKIANDLYWAQDDLEEAGLKAEADIVKNLFEELKALRKNLQSKYPECDFSTVFENIRQNRGDNKS